MGNKTGTRTINKDTLFSKAAALVLILLLSCISFCQSAPRNAPKNSSANDPNDKLLDQYVQAKGTGIITFDASNIKQFWIDKSVVAKKNSFEVALSESGERAFESVPLKIKLVRVSEVQDCRIEVIAEAGALDFSVLNNSSKVVSTSSPEDDFLQYKVAAAVLHLEDTRDLSFSLKFRSKDSAPLAIKKVILSFSDNKNSRFLASPGMLTFTEKDMEDGNFAVINESDHSFAVSGKRFVLLSRKKILIGDKELSHSVTIKNIGENPTTIYFGYAPYTKAHLHLQNNNTPYNNKNTVFKIISAEVNSNRIIADSLPEWEKGCYLALNAKEDLSDFPNFSFVNGTISEVKKLDNGQAEIIMDKPVQAPIKQGTTARIQARPGAANLYIFVRRLNPGEEVTLASKIRRDDNFLQYSSEAFCRGTYYVAPLISFQPVNANEEIKIRISDFTVSY